MRSGDLGPSFINTIVDLLYIIHSFGNCDCLHLHSTFQKMKKNINAEIKLESQIVNYTRE